MSERKIVAGEFVSLDGVIEAPDELTSKYGGPGFMDFLGAGMAESDALLLGKSTGEEAPTGRRVVLHLSVRCYTDLRDAHDPPQADDHGNRRARGEPRRRGGTMARGPIPAGAVAATGRTGA
jgi:hypothetical protein